MMKKLLCAILFTVFAVGLVQAQADINVQGNGIDIVDGDITPDLADHTDFGDVAIGGNFTRVYTIENTGDALLTIANITLDFPPPSEYSLDFTGFDPTLDPAQSTTFSVTFTPSGLGAVDSGITIESDDPDAESDYTFAITAAGSSVQDINVQGNGIDIVDGDTTPDLADHTDFGDVTVGSSLTRVYTIQNTGGATLTISNISFDFPPSSEFAFDFTGFDASLDPLESTTFSVIFTPSGVGIVNSGITIESNDPDTESDYTFSIAGNGSNDQDINVQGNGVDIADGDTTPDLADHTDFGNVAVGGSLTRVFTIENTGGSLLTISNVALDFPPPSEYAIDFTGFDTTLGPGESTTFSVTFTPTTTGAVNSGITITSDDPDAEGSYTYAITGNGVVEQDINVQGNGVDIADGDTTPDLADHTDFGDVNVGADLTRVFTIQNTGGSLLTIANVALDFPPPTEYSLDFTGFDPTLDPSESTTFSVTFTPTAAGVVNSGITITSDDPDAEGSYTYAITANGVVANEPEMDITYSGGPVISGTTTVDFGTVNVSSGSSSTTFTIENNGTVDLNLTDPSPYVSITGVNASDFTLTVVPDPTIAAAGSTTFIISFDPSALGVRTANVSIANNDSDENPYTFSIVGVGIDANAGSPLLITQYYEGTGSNQWIEVKNVSTSAVTAGSFFLALYNGGISTTTNFITQNPPNQSIAIPALAAGEVIIFNNPGATLPTAGNLGGTGIGTSVCTFDGNDVILISTTNDAGCYDARIDIMGVVGNASPPFWGQDTSFIKGCGTDESPTVSFDYTSGTNTVNDYIELTLDEVNNANSATNIALGTQTVGTTIYTVAWNNGIPDRTKDAIISGAYAAGAGSFETCNLTVSGLLNMNGGTTNFVRVNENLSVSGSFIIGDTESLVTVDESATISGSVTKLESSTTLNNYFDFTYWSSPVFGANIGTVFSGVDPNRIFQWQEPSPGSFGAWLVASGTMTTAKGYISEAPVGSTQHNISFTGTPNNGLLGITLGFDPSNTGNGGGFNLIGNPYPSAIDADLFITDEDNTELDGTIWLWTHNTAFVDNPGIDMDFTVDDYATYNLSGGTAATSGGPIPTSNIGSSQGFFVRTLSAGVAAFNNGMRLDGQNNQFFRGTGKKKSNEEKDRIWLDVTSNEGGAFNQILVGFFDEATDGFDRGYDGVKFSGGNYISFYSKIGEDKYAIQGLGTYSSDKQVSLGFDSFILQTFKISISQIEGILKTEEVYLVDNELGIVHDLKASDYEFEITETGSYTDRFILQFNKSVLSIDDETLESDFLVINDNGTLRLRSKSVLKDVKVYDILGRKLIDAQPNLNEYPLETSGIARGTVLIIKAVLENGAEVSKKSIRY